MTSLGRPKLSIQFSQLCENVFDRKAETQRVHEAAQKALLEGAEQNRDPSVHQSEVRHVLGDHAGELMSWSFPSISLRQLLSLLLEYQYEIPPNRPAVMIPDAVAHQRVAIFARNYPAGVLTNLLLAHLQIEVTCSANSLRFHSNRPLTTTFFTPHLATRWEGEIELAEGGLAGSGTVHFEDAFSIEGQIQNSYLNGPGRFVGGTTLVGKNFKNNVLTGQAEWQEKDETIYVGGYLDNQRHGAGRMFHGRWRYEGQFEYGLPHGEGYIEHVEHLAPPGTPLKYAYPLNYENYRVRSSFRGSWVEGDKHGTGVCRLFTEAQSGPEFPCEFYYGSLVKVGDHSLLPRIGARSEHVHRLAIEPNRPW